MSFLLLNQCVSYVKKLLVIVFFWTNTKIFSQSRKIILVDIWENATDTIFMYEKLFILKIAYNFSIHMGLYGIVSQEVFFNP